MSKEETDYFGNRIKSYEERYTSSKLDSHLPFVARIDGKGFSKYTKKFEKPFDHRLTDVFKKTTHSLLLATNATAGYTQSDEISLVFDSYENPLSSHWFDGKVSKLNSVIASMTTAFFMEHIREYIQDASPAIFDCRVFSVPDKIEASNAILWRVQDARKNSISSYARWTIGHSKMQNLSGPEMVGLIFKETGKRWEDLPSQYKYGILLKGKSDIPMYDGQYYGSLPLVERVNFVTRTKEV